MRLEALSLQRANRAHISPIGCPYFIVGIGYLIIEKINLPIAFQIPTTGILVFILSWGIVSLFYRFIPKYAKWIMG